MPKRPRCAAEVIDRATKRKRKCKNQRTEGEDKCKTHLEKVSPEPVVKEESQAEESQAEESFFADWEEGTCCFCGDACNPMSQSCGYCARRLTMRAMGWL